jgi:hypothetical protein
MKKEKDDNKEIVISGSIPAKIENITPYEMMLSAVKNEIPLEQIEKMMELQERHDKNEAKKAFITAMAKFKEVPLIITKDKKNTQYNSKYTTIGNLVNSTLPGMSKCGLSHKWDMDQTVAGVIKITCVVTHAMGHSESVSMSAPPDKSGSKNPIQEIKSTRTYLQAATFESIMGLASSDANIDDDGNGSKQKQLPSLSEETIETINSFDTIEELKIYYKESEEDCLNKVDFAKLVNAKKKELEKLSEAE